MASWKKFEDIEAWQKSRELSRAIYEIIKSTDLVRDFELNNQMKRSSGSIMDNIAEGFERGGNKEFIYFLGIAKGSCAELRSQLYRCIDQHYIVGERYDELHDLTLHISKMLSGIISHLKNSSFKGYKFSESPVEYQSEE